MNKLILTLCILISTSALADCFIAMENKQILVQEGECKKVMLLNLLLKLL